MSGPVDRLNAIMARLRAPVGGCPWDVEQTFATIAPYTIEEAYEVADAIERGDYDDLRSELGDLLFQVVFHARMAEEQGLFVFDDVANAMADKLERRHPHVFGDEAAKAFARAVNTDDDRTDVALADRHVVRKRVRLFASDDPAKDVEA